VNEIEQAEARGYARGHSLGYSKGYQAGQRKKASAAEDVTPPTTPLGERLIQLGRTLQNPQATILDLVNATRECGLEFSVSIMHAAYETQRASANTRAYTEAPALTTGSTMEQLAAQQTTAHEETVPNFDD